MEIDYTPKLTYADVLLQPNYSDLDSREDVDITTTFAGQNINPIISANMDYVTGIRMAKAMCTIGAYGILNRFEDLDSQDIQIMSGIRSDYIISVGTRDSDYEIDRIGRLERYIRGVCIDVAHGNLQKVIVMIHRITAKFPNLYLIAGNVATEDGFYNLAQAGADAIKVGIGPGSVCTTRTVTGIGYPQFSAVMECAEVAKQYKRHLIADGGINSSGDIVKALAAGADSVMLGHLLAGHDECPGDILTLSGNRKVKPYRGQSINGSNGKRYAPEGIEGVVPARGPVADTMKKLVGGIKSGFAYVGARNIEELRAKARFIVVSGATSHENGTRVEVNIGA